MYLLNFLYFNIKRKAKEKAKNQLEKSIIRDKNENANIQETTSKIKNSNKAAALIQKMDKIIRSNKFNILWLTLKQCKIFEKFVNMIK